MALPQDDMAAGYPTPTNRYQVCVTGPDGTDAELACSGVSGLQLGVD
jgi:hypothetical protein